MTRLRVLLSEASSLTAREHLTVLGMAGVRVEAMGSDRFALCRWSRWARRLHPCPASGTDPAGYLQAVSAVLAEGGFGRRVRGGAGCAAARVLLPPAVRGAGAVRAVPCRAGCIGRAGPGVFWDALVGPKGTRPVAYLLASCRAGPGRPLGAGG